MLFLGHNSCFQVKVLPSVDSCYCVFRSFSNMLPRHSLHGNICLSQKQTSVLYQYYPTSHVENLHFHLEYTREWLLANCLCYGHSVLYVCHSWRSLCLNFLLPPPSHRPASRPSRGPIAGGVSPHSYRALACALYTIRSCYMASFSELWLW